jgi:hypothetical protein
VKAAEVALAINAHLKRIEHDPEINRRDALGGHPFLHAEAIHAGSRSVYVRYAVHRGGFKLWKKEAVAYLEWLDAGNVGTHLEVDDLQEANG